VVVKRGVINSGGGDVDDSLLIPLHIFPSHQEEKKYSAFSLIELSIVLIIMGLLVAGITGGASLIKTVQLRNVIAEFDKIRVAYNNYYVRFSRVPGAVNDDPNKMKYLGLNVTSFRDLKVGGFLDDELIAIKGSSYSFFTVNIASKFRKNTFWHIGGISIVDTVNYINIMGSDEVSNKNALIISSSIFRTDNNTLGVYRDFNGNDDNCKSSNTIPVSCFLTSTTIETAICLADETTDDCTFTPTDAKFIDEKIDDGKLSGNVRVAMGTISNSDIEIHQVLSDTSEYNVDIKNKIYRLIMFLDF
jgi:hypothetical protein